jgi:Ferritin-like domain
MDRQDDLVRVQESRAVSRRAFGRTAIAASLGAAGAAVLGGNDAQAQTLTDADILNFALNLEYLEAEFYTRFTTGRRIADFGIGTSGTGQSGTTTGGRRLDFGGSLRTILHEIADNERDHVTFLRDALGPAAVAKPAINLDALGAVTSVNQFLVLARAFEDVGVSAYGAAAKLISNMDTLEAAARIALTEAYHAGNIRLIVAQRGIATQMLDANDYPPPPTGTKYFTTSRVGLAKIRRPSLVLAIVYGRRTAGTSRGGFFPNGVNGTIRTV